MSKLETSPAPKGAWGFARPGDDRASLPEVHASIHVPKIGSWMRKLMAFAGPGYMISVGYMDPGNWATDIAGGSQFGYTLLSVIMISNLMAILLQALSARLGIATGRDLAQACRDHYSPPVRICLWLACEVAIIACDLAEVIGTAIALQLLFGIPLIGGALITALDTFLLLLLMNKGFRFLEAFVVSMLTIIALCFLAQIIAAQPPVAEILSGFIPSTEVITNREMLYVAIGIIGATVMPHNLYLHSSIVQTRAYERNDRGRKDAIKWATLDSTIALMLALFVNASILIIAAVVFHANGRTDVEEIEQAHQLLSPLLGFGLASTLFAVALLASGINSTVTATLAGQIVMEGFLRLTIPNWARRLLTRCLAIIPVVIVTWLYGNKGTAELLVLSQVILSMQLPFAVVPLVQFVSDKRKMGSFVISRWTAALAWVIAAIIIALNLKLLWDVFSGAV
ncbi:Nramp family divalent metal transporter [Agrobacterium vitis]|uniref:Divalent metal cation transporter MntH n=1 Tax=Agrobacterium vitis TaxID=373 RepID=A0AAE2RHC2_AGRVI|nr:Nramp family divalent metal transporter [Agrobacterium vitis]MBF2716542.1 Nramp family divalent metal transporter [Agrobacterium vitis]MUZ64188.1 Mn(2+) uptake NRAMP transporter MntH [Agrobacterium vitis]MVA21376.1 Mn(2+) uptake NRAMP transporter MntH [Agrobacterium vitis]